MATRELIQMGGQVRARASPGWLELPRILYHGTTFGYLMNNLERWNEYEGWYGKVYLGKTSHESMPYAHERAKYHHDLPMLLIIDKTKLAYPLNRSCTGLTTPSLNMGCFFVKGLCGETNIGGMETSLNDIETELISSTKEQVKQITAGILGLKNIFAKP